MDHISEKQIDDAADALRRFEMSGKTLNDWERIANHQKNKWREKVKIVLTAALTGGSR